MAGSVSQSFGDIEKIECPDPDRFNEFIEIGQIQGAVERATVPLTGRYANDVASELLRLSRKRCSVDVQVHFGTCTNPSDFDVFTKALILEDARLTSYDTEDLGALSSDASAAVNESVELSVKNVYEILQLSFQSVAGDTITNELVDGVVCDQISCGDCDDESAGCEKIYYVSLSAGGSPSTPADVVFSIDNGANWYAHDVDSLGAAEDPTGIACVGTYVVVVSNDSNSLHYATKSEILPTNDETWTEVTTGFVVTGEPNDIWSVGTYAFVVGDGGYIYGTSDPTSGVTVLNAGVATVNDLNAVHALDKNFAVAVGNSGAIIKTDNQTTWGAITPTNVNFIATNFQAVWVKNESEWWLGATDGGLWYTLDGGVTFTQAGLPGTSTAIYDIQFASDSVLYVADTIAGPRGRILRSFNGGNTFTVLPEGTANLPLNDQITALATCTDDVNFVTGGGLADNGTDGILVVGQD
jgi:photosystem II stability/assembly factor-like uncharacterized protein